MPPRIPRACRKRGCAKTTTDRSGYCEEHRNTGWESHQQGKSRNEREYLNHHLRVAAGILNGSVYGKPHRPEQPAPNSAEADTLCHRSGYDSCCQKD
ncbi:HNH endonuclease [Morganella morganii]|uniref:HNH endonuclease n=1 Tax=Morganella morganii TaxID=582 RepID=UPI0035E46751